MGQCFGEFFGRALPRIFFLQINSPPLFFKWNSPYALLNYQIKILSRASEVSPTNHLGSGQGSSSPLNYQKLKKTDRPLDPFY